MKRQLHLNLFIHSRGHHEASWRHPDASRLPLTDIRYYTDLAQRAEAALFDSIFLADQLALSDDLSQAARTWLEPITVLTAQAMATERIGLIGTCSTTYTEPFNLARQFGSLDHISNGRAGWNIVTSWLAAAAANYGGEGQLSHADRYARGEEYMEVVKALWDSWAEDAVIDDRSAGGIYADTKRIRPINHKGAHYQVCGPLNMPRTPQGRPVLVQAGSSDTGKRFAARHAEAVFTAHLEKTTAQAFYADLKTLTAAEGRSSEHVLILPGLSPMIASTEAEAQRLARELDALTDPEVGRKRLAGRFGHDLSHLPLDRPLVPEDFPPSSAVESARSRTEVILGLVRRENPTLRQLLATFAGARGHFTFAGTPAQVADLIEDWFTDGAADGFNIMPPLLPSMLEVFGREVVPLLQKRGLFRTAYSGKTLREHYGLPWPASAFDQTANAPARATA
ncbi:MAG: LLM class flavin-dependent oxidoreductase [Alphaproteobacteria bacterium]|nr:LLM class flavin-dependent oxidoreductase [Alphaproteobacteria bacterium]